LLAAYWFATYRKLLYIQQASLVGVNYWLRYYICSTGWRIIYPSFSSQRV